MQGSIFYAVAAYTVNHGWSFLGENGTLTKDWMKATLFKDAPAAIQYAHDQDEKYASEYYSHPLMIKVKYDYQLPLQPARKR